MRFLFEFHRAYGVLKLYGKIHKVGACMRQTALVERV